MSPLRISLSLITVILMSATSFAQVDGYTCINEYLDCADIIESESDIVQLQDFTGKPGDTVWLPVSLNVPSDTVDAFIILIDWDDAYLQPVPLPGDSVYLEYELAGDFALVADDFFVMLSQNAADEGAILAFFNLGIGPYSVLAPGDHGVIFRLPFVVDASMPWGATAAFGFQETNEYMVTDSVLMEAFCADCRRTQMSIVHDCEIEIYDTVATDPLVIDTLMDTASCSAALYPTTVGGSFTAQANGGAVYLGAVDGLVSGMIPCGFGTDVVFHFGYTNLDHVNKAKLITNGFRLTATGGATWTPGAYGDEFSWGPAGDNFDLVWSTTPNPWLGQSGDIIGFGGSAVTGPGLVPGYDGPAVYFTVNFGFQVGLDGQTFCIDSTFYPPSGAWMWAYGSTVGSFPPDWDGPYCWVLGGWSSLCPVFVVPVTNYTGDHCDLVVIQYSATDIEGDPLTFSVVVGVGNVTDHGNGTCTYTYQPTLADVGASVTADILVDDGMHGSPSSCTPITLTMNFTNEAPVFTGGIGTAIIQCLGQTNCFTISGDDVDCDPSSVNIVDVSPTPVGTVDVTDNGDNTWTVCFHSDDPGDGGAYYTVTLEITDGVNANTGDLFFTHFECLGYEVQIEKTHGTLQGMHTIVDVTQNKGGEDMGGWDFLIAYDASALFFQAAIPGDLHTICGWEYFNYRYGPFGNCGNACPSGMLRVVAIAETNNGPNHPLCLSLDPKPVVLFSLDFLVSNDRTLECMYVPIRFFWMDCGDNSIAYHPVDDPMASIQGVSRYVIDFDLIGHIEDMFTGFPTYTGVQWECFDNDPDKPTPVQIVDFYNGGVDIICADSIDARGDINLNGTANEIADAVLFSNYFVKGIGVFNVNYQGQIAATDVNADGLTLSVADLVYQIRIIVGDALPYPKLSPMPAQYSFNDGILSVDTRMGAALAVFAGDIIPTLLANNMEMRYHSDGAETRVLISKIEIGASFEGAFLQAGSELISLEMAAYDGTPVVFKTLPEQFGLFQNYPNPFNPKTTIAFALPTGGDYSLTIFNVTGQEVVSFTGVAEGGQIETVEFDATDIASGVYFYRLDTDGFSQSRKMVLMK